MSLTGKEPKNILVKSLQGVVNDYTNKVIVGATEHGFSFSVRGYTLIEVNTWEKACILVSGMKLLYTFSKEK